MTEEINRKNLLRTCRLCLENISEACTLLPIYENENLSRGYFGRYLKEFNESIPEIISSCVGIEVRM